MYNTNINFKGADQASFFLKPHDIDVVFLNHV